MRRRAPLLPVVLAALLPGVLSLCLVLSLTLPAAADVVYLYDALGRLVRVIDATGEAATFIHDSVGNILRITRQTGIPQNQTMLTSVSPTSAAQGGRVTLTFTGTNLAGASLLALPPGLTLISTGLAVNGGEDVLTITLAVDPEFPLGMQSLTLLSALGGARLPFSLDVQRPAPRVDRLLPPTVVTGGLVQIEGAGFDPADRAANAVTVNGVPLRVVSARSDVLIAQVVPGLTTGPVTVTTASGSGVSPMSLTVISGTHPQQNVVAATLQSPFRGPSRLALSPDGTRAYVMNIGLAPFGGTVSVTSGSVAAIDTAQARVLKVLPAGGPRAIAVTPDGARLAIATTSPAGLTLLDTTTLAVTTTIPYPAAARDVAVSPDGRFAYVAIDTPALSVVDLATLTEVARIPLARQALFVALAPDGGTVYAIRGDWISIIDAAAHQVTRTIATSIPLNIDSIALDSVTQRLYMGGATQSPGFPFVVVVDLAAGAVLQTISNFTTVALSPDHRRLYLAGAGTTLSVLDAVTLSTTGTVTVGGGRSGIFAGQAVVPSADGNTVWVANANDNTVSVVDAGALTLVANVPVGIQPTALGRVAGGTDLYVLNGGGNTVSVLDTEVNAVRSSALDALGLAQPLGAVAPAASASAFVANSTARTTVAFTQATGQGVVTLPLGDGHPGIHLTVALGRNEVYVGSQSPAGVWVLDLTTRERKRLLPMARAPRAMVLSLDERRLYVITDLNTNVGAQLTVFDATTAATLARVTLDATRTADDIALNTEGTRLYVLLNRGGTATTGTVQVIDTATTSVVAAVAVGSVPVRLTFGHVIQRLYVVNSDSISVIDPAANNVVATIPANSFVTNNLVLALDGSKAYLAGSGVKVIDTTTNTLVASIPAGFVRAVALSPDGQRVFATSEFSPGQLTIIDTTTNQAIKTLTVGGSSTTLAGGFRPINVMFSPDGARAWVVNTLDDSLSVIE